MAIANKLTRRLSEVFGMEAADAMIDWMQNVEGGRAELRELNDLSFARFASLLGERIAEVNARTDTLIAGVHGRIDRLEGQMDGRLEALESCLCARIDTRATELSIEFRVELTRLTRWSMGILITSLLALVTTLTALAVRV